MSGTIAFSDELNYFPGIHLNLRDREPSGLVHPNETQEAILRVRAALLAVRDPWNGNPVFADVVRREELFEGPYLERAPDLLLDLHLDDGYSYNLMPSGRASEPFRRLAPEEYLGKKGRSLPGSHRARGFMAMAGPSVVGAARIDAHIADVTATLLHRMGLSVPTELRGRVLWEAVREERGKAATSLPATTSLPARPPANEGIVESRLRALGYIE